MMLQGCLDEIHELPSHKIHPRLYVVLLHLILWVKHMYFHPRYFRDFLEAVRVEKGPFRAIFGWPIRAGRKSLPFPHTYHLIAVIRTWILFRLKVSQLLQLRVRLLGQRPEEDRLFRIPPL
jgi:hypothetical protein